jgi:hypothetical protein
MISRKLSRLLTAYVDGELNVRQRKAVRRLLRQSSRARRLYRQMKGDALVLQTLPWRELDQDLSSTILDKINTTLPDIQLPAAARQPARMRRPVWAAAAAVLLAVGLGSYCYFSDTREAGPVAVHHTGEPTPQVSPTPDLATTRPSNPESVFAFPNLKAPQLKVAQVRVPTVLSVRDLSRPTTADELQNNLRKEPLHRLDLFADNSTKALEQVRAVGRAQGIEIRIDPAAQEFVKRGLERTWALYVENIRPDEVAQLLSKLSAADKTSRHFQQATLTAITADELADVLGGAGKDLAPPSQRPVEHGTAGQIVSSLPRPSPETQAQHRLLVVPYEAPRETPYDEVKNLLDGYREVRPGTVQLLVVLWGSAN